MLNGVPVLFDAPRVGEPPRRRQGGSRERHDERTKSAPPRKDVVELAAEESRRDRERDAKAGPQEHAKTRRPDAGFGPIDLRA